MKSTPGICLIYPMYQSHTTMLKGGGTGPVQRLYTVGSRAYIFNIAITTLPMFKIEITRRMQY